MMPARPSLRRLRAVISLDDDKVDGDNGTGNWVPNNNLTEQVIARPATHRRAGSPYMDSAYVAAGKKLYAMRFAKTDGSQWNNTANWQLDEFFSPESPTRNQLRATNALVSAPVNRIIMTYAGDPMNASDPPVFALSPDGTLPLAAGTAPAILNRPKLANILVPSGSKPDLFVGTGDTMDPANPRVQFENANFFYALHDFNLQGHNNDNDGRALWVAKFCGDKTVTVPPALPPACTWAPPGVMNGREQIVSEPAIISSCVIVATYTPDASAGGCGIAGDTVLYGFKAISGDLTPCLVYPPGTPWAGQPTSVIRMSGVGIPSDLIVINDTMYFSTSNDPSIHQVTVRQNPRAGAVRSYRRLK